MYLILEIMAKINKELVQPPYKLSIAKSLILSISFNTISSVINEHIKRGITSTKAMLYLKFYKTYYVVAQMGLNNISFFKYYFEIDYMLETMFFVYCLLFINTFCLYKLDHSRYNILLSSENNSTRLSRNKDINIQSAENCKGFSETVRQLPDTKDYKF